METLLELLKKHDILIQPDFSGVIIREGSQWLVGREWSYQGKEFKSLNAGDWKTDKRFEWRSYEKLTKEEFAEADKIVNETLKLEAEERRKEWMKIAMAEVHPVWKSTPPPEDGETTPYLKRKQLNELFGAKLLDNPSHDKIIIVPMRDASGNMWNIQRIYSQKLSKGDKFFHQGAKIEGLFHTVTPIREDENPSEIYIAEGFATAASITLALRSKEETPAYVAVVCAFNAGNLEPAAKDLRHKYPAAKITICADNDAFTEIKGKPYNVGIEKAKAAAQAVDAELRYPIFKRSTRGFTDFNDLMCAEGLEEVRRQLCEPGEVRALPWYEEINKDYAVVSDAGKIFVYRSIYNYELEQQTYESMGFEDFKKFYSNKYHPNGGNLGTKWLASPKRREYTDVTFAPGTSVPKDVLNLWQGFTLKPAPGNWDLLRQHLLEVWCSGDEKHYQYLISWFAKMLQEPGRQGEVAVVLRGGQGTGKGMVAHAIGRIFGTHYKALSNPKHIVGDFNGFLRQTIFLFADEALFAGARSQTGILNSIITEPHLTVEAKYKNPVICRNCTHVLMASNNDWVVPAGPDARRYFVLDVSSKYQQNQEYFNRLALSFKDGAVEAFMHDMLNLDLSAFEVREAPRTKGLEDQKLHTLGAIETWLYEALDEGVLYAGQPWNGEAVEVEKDSLHQNFLEWAKNNGFRPIAKNVFCRKIRSILRGVTEHKILAKNGSGVRVRTWTVPSIVDSRKEMMRWLKFDVVQWAGEDVGQGQDETM